MRHAFRTAMALAVLAALPGCGAVQSTMSSITGSGPRAVAKLAPTTGNQAAGDVTFTQVGDKVRVSGEVRGLKPNSEHGFHVHEKGDCSSGDGMSAGGHYNPSGAPHARHGMPPHHVGDLPSLKADANGVARVDFESSSISLTSATNIIGKGLIVHRDPDDYKTQPTGNAGPRLACAVIAAAS